MGGTLRALDLIDYPLYMVAMNALPPTPAVWDATATRLGRRVASSHRRERAVVARVAASPAARRDVAARLGAHRPRRRRLRPAHLPGVPHRRLGRRLPQQHVPHVAHARARGCSPDRGCTRRRPPHLPVRTSTTTSRSCASSTSTCAVASPCTSTSPTCSSASRRRPSPTCCRWTARGCEVDEWPRRTPSTSCCSTGTGHGVDVLPVRGDVGIAGWNSCAGGLPWGQSLDQRHDNAMSIVHDFPITAVHDPGNGEVRLQVRSSAPVGHVR